MSETTGAFNGEKSTSAAVPPPSNSTSQPPYATYGGNPNDPMALQATVYPPAMDPSIQRIREYLPWSIINVCLGGFILGTIAIILSLQTRNRKRSGNVASVRKWSIATLIFNIFVTVLAIAIIIFLIVWYVTVVNTFKAITSSYYISLG